MKKLPKKIYTAEFKAQAVQHAKAQGTGIAARALGLRAETLRHWVKAEASGQPLAATSASVTPETMELSSATGR